MKCLDFIIPFQKHLLKHGLILILGKIKMILLSAHFQISHNPNLSAKK